MKRWALVVLLGLAACGQGQRSERTEELQTFDVEDRSTTDSVAERAPPGIVAPTAAPPPPNVSVSAAPGVAFNYRYDYRLQPARISQVQEEHAAMCERLGLARCRITGMRYTVQDEREIDASLALALDPAIARQFGREAEGAVTRAEGTLVNMEIGGRDVGTGITRARRDAVALRRELSQAEAALARRGLDAASRDRLLARAEDIRAQLRGLERTREAGEEELATTPMVFNYGSGASVPGLSGSPIRDAWRDAGHNFGSAVAVLITIISLLLPWALLIGLAAWIIVRLSAWRARREATRATREGAA